MPDDQRSFPDVASVTMALTPSYPVFCLRPRLIAQAARRFIEAFPGTPLYAIKCNPHRLILDALHEAGGCSLLTQILLRKGDQLYVNDGIYGSLAELRQVRIEPPARLIRIQGGVSSRLAGFTLPEDAREGDWIEIDQMGAYSNALATHLNGLYPEAFVEVRDDPAAEDP